MIMKYLDYGLAMTHVLRGLLLSSRGFDEVIILPNRKRYYFKHTEGEDFLSSN